MLLLLNAVPNFYWISQHSEPTCIREFFRVKRVRRCVHARQYIGFLKQILFFFCFHRIPFNKYLFFPYFHLVSMLLINVWSCDLLSWCFYSGVGGWGGMGEEMDIVVGFLLKNSVSYSKFVSAQTEGGGRSAKCG